MVPAVLMISGALVGEHVLKTQEGRPRALGLFLFIVAFASLALAVGVGRGARPCDGLDSHYGTAALPVLCWAYLVSDIYVSRTASRLVQMSLFALMCDVFALNTSDAVACVERLHCARRRGDRARHPRGCPPV